MESKSIRTSEPSPTLDAASQPLRAPVPNAFNSIVNFTYTGSLFNRGTTIAGMTGPIRPRQHILSTRANRECCYSRVCKTSTGTSREVGCRNRKRDKTQGGGGGGGGDVWSRSTGSVIEMGGHGSFDRKSTNSPGRHANPLPFFTRAVAATDETYDLVLNVSVSWTVLPRQVYVLQPLG